MPPRTVAIVNASAGGGRHAQTLHDIAAQRPWLELAQCSGPDDTRRLVIQAIDRGAEVIAAGGGDGTVHAVLNALAPHLSAARFAIIPLGTANDFAAALGLPKNPAQAVDLIAGGGARRIDVVKVSDSSDRYMLNAATAGISTLVREKLDAQTKSRWGVLAYLRVGLEALPELPMHEVTFDLDDRRITQRVCAVMVANGYRAGGIALDPAAEPDDHRMDVLAITAETVAQRAALLARFAVGTHLESEHVFFQRAARLRVEASPRMAFNCDGENVAATPLEFQLLPGALEIVAPLSPVEET